MPRYPARPEYQALPWRQIREQYETTDVSQRALAMQWNNPQDHRRGLDPTHRPYRHHPRAAPGRRSERFLAGAQRRGREDRRRHHSAPRGGRRHPLTARALATMQSQRVLRQLEIAEEIQKAGRAILRHLLGVLTGEEDKVGEHIKRLLAICPDGEKLATLVKSAAEAIDRAVIIERRALGMDMIKGTVPDPAGGSLDSCTDNAIRTVRKMDLSLGLRLREFTAAVAEEKREQRHKK
jgi:hypothetical protein